MTEESKVLCELCGTPMEKITDEVMGIYFKCPNCEHELEIHFK